MKVPETVLDRPKFIRELSSILRVHSKLPVGEINLGRVDIEDYPCLKIYFSYGNTLGYAVYGGISGKKIHEVYLKT